MKIQTALRFDEELLTILKEKAKAQHRSLNNYIENLLYNEVGNIPNAETKKAIEEAQKSDNLTEVENLDAYLDQL